jgi:uncharacterized protein (DUF58 family)
MQQHFWFLGALAAVIVGVLSIPTSAAPKVIVHVGLPFFCTVAEVPDDSGTQVCVRLEVYPWTQKPVALTEHAPRTSIATTSTSCESIKTLVINRMAVEFPSVSVTAEEIMTHSCTR